MQLSQRMNCPIEQLHMLSTTLAYHVDSEQLGYEMSVSYIVTLAKDLKPALWYHSV